MTTPDPRLEALNEAWKEFLATALRRNIVVAVNDHRALVEAAVLRYHPPLDVERLAAAIAANTAISFYHPGEAGFRDTVADIAAEYDRLSEDPR